jgi:hypothetical protein
VKPVHPAIKILTAAIFIILMSGFVAFKSGAFDGTKSAQLKLNVSVTGVSYHRKEERELPSKRTVYERKGKREPVIVNLPDDWMLSSKTIGTTISWNAYSSVFASEKNWAMMAGSKSATIVTPPQGSVYGGIFSIPYRWKAKSKGEQLKQGR